MVVKNKNEKRHIAIFILLKKFGLLILVFLTFACKNEKTEIDSQITKKQPLNIVFFLVDDLGWKDVGCYGSSFYETPNIDQLAQLKATKDRYDVCISIVGEEPHSEWLGDSMSMAMEEEEEGLLRAAVATGIPVVMVGMIGRPQQLMWADEHVASILWAYLPGTEGAEPIADVLFGDYNPSGHTSISFPKNANQIPVVYNARSYECYEITTKYEPLYPFGYGLSYTEFKYSHLQVPKEVFTGKGMDVSVKVKNMGSVEGATVVQLYLKDMYASVTRPLKSLKAFKKVTLVPGEEKTIVMRLSPKDLSLYDEYLNLVEEKRKIEVQIGDQSKKFSLI